MRKDPPIEIRFWSKVKPASNVNECWEWLAAKGKHGYGIFRANGKAVICHRLSYEWIIGKIPEGLQIDHLCRNRGCVNPYHMEPVTNKINGLRGESFCAKYARQTHCKNGHPLTPDNLDSYALSIGKRHCIICRNEKSRIHSHNYYIRKKAKINHVSR